MMRPTAAFGGVLMALSIACSEDVEPVFPAALERPGRAALLCVEAKGGPVPLERCRRGASDERPSGVALHALVTQTARGALAVIDLDSGALQDSDRRVPGFTFVDVGEVPADVLVGSARPTHAYIASFGGRAIRAISTRRLLGNDSSEPDVIVRLAGAPVDLALDPGQRALWAALPDEGAVVVLALDAEGRPLEPPTPIRFDARWAEPQVTVADPPYERACGVRLLRPPPRPAPPGVALGEAPRPVALAVDADAGLILVADEALPVIHVVRPSDGARLDPIATGRPLRALALGPNVPDAVGGATSTRRYLYGIDAVDGRVVAMDYAADRGGAAARLLDESFEVGAEFPALELAGAARTIEVVETGGDASWCDPAGESRHGREIGPDRLRGVFLAVGMQDGRVQFVDVHDRDAPCRGPTECGGLGVASDGIVAVRRHRPRVGAFLVEPPGLRGDPTVSRGVLTLPLQADGTSVDPRLPRLGRVECPEGWRGVWGEPGPRVCIAADPHVVVAESWTAQWEGDVPGAAGGRGRLERAADGEVVLHVEIDPCAFGVLGAEDAAGDGHDGDAVALRSPPPPSVPADRCAEWRRPIDETRDRYRSFRIRAAFVDRLVLEVPEEDRDALLECHPELVQYGVHARARWLVSGSRSGVRHRVRRAEGGRCVLDPEGDPRARMRAASGESFDNGRIVLRIEPGDDGGQPTPMPGERAAVQLVVGGVPPVLSVSADVGTLPSQLVWSPEDARLFLVDASAGLLARIQVSPLRVERLWR
ncbi:MAG: hypothetical protein NZ898_16310 [Myxococcota bacterium]|nr:hypothetical protein [Myxococcota bacterium]MDW8361118.1 hypothetical protein [Myxococcales bacterium]